MWCGVLNNRILRPIFYNGNLNGQNYLELIKSVPNSKCGSINNEIIWQQDGAPVHIIADVT